MRDLVEQNHHLQAQVEAQQKVIDQLGAKIDAIGQSGAEQAEELQAMKANLGQPPAAPGKSGPDPEHEIRIRGEAGLGFFNSGSEGQYPNGDFRVDEARIFLEAPIFENTFFVSELDLMTREAGDQNFHLGELYADFENVSGRWGQDNLVNVKAGRFSIPFGEEYQTRYAVDNALVSHSLSDIWGFDQGVELYGGHAAFTYVVAVQDGGLNALHNFSSDKSVSGRIGYDPKSWLHLSASAMRTGRINPTGDQLSAVWFANGFFRALSASTPATRFGASLFELDAAARWAGGSLKGAAGVMRFNDNAPAAADARHLSYFYIEGVQHVTENLYGAVRFSEIHAPQGFPLVGQGKFGEYFSDNSTTRLSRLSMGLGYQFGPPLILKVEYSPEWGMTLGGKNRDNENLLSTELGVKF